mmetsp:Transcript_26625/g.39506  ORF Transcript_26625/g.39506 Transcript_26625/m.39506 type:complete len:98 (-) Transcript_26625:1313-1606(-)
MTVTDGAIPVPSKGASTRLKVTLLKGEDGNESGFYNSNAEALVQRVPVLDTDPENEEIDGNRPILTLLNILTALPSSLLKRVGMLLSRLDNLSNALV